MQSRIPSHTCLLNTITKSLFIGDLIYEGNSILYEIPHTCLRDPRKNRISIRLLQRKDLKHTVPSHGNLVLGKGKMYWLIIL